MISYKDHAEVCARFKEADRRQTRFDPDYLLAAAHAIMSHVLDQLWALCIRREEEKPKVKGGKDPVL